MRGIWSAIEFMVDHGYWDPMSRSPKVFMEALRSTTYGLLVRIIGHWVRGGKMNTELSVSASARLKDFQTTSHVDDPPTWPKAPPKGERPSSVVEWIEFAAAYRLAADSPYYQRLLDRITETSLQQKDDEVNESEGDSEEDSDSDDGRDGLVSARDSYRPDNDDNSSDSSLSDAQSVCKTFIITLV